MNFQSYLNYFEAILNDSNPSAPYDNPDYYNYTKLNWARMNRWLKTAEVSEEIKESISKISKPQQWIIITEPWCGDAAHSVPFLHMIAAMNPLITVDYELRDTEPFRINTYLTNGGKSIPKLIIKNENDIAVWGPRPAKCQLVYASLVAEKADLETMKIGLQNWYNHDKGVEIQKELKALLQPVNV
ncbi:MAG: thioredoxin family protein [Bacteroidota bacterium]